jgi:hypothetical protein
MQLVSPRFGIEIGAIHHHLHVSYLLYNVHHIEVTLNSLFKVVIELVSLWKSLTAAIATKESPKSDKAMTKPLA